jgi:hypothetical protein
MLGFVAVDFALAEETFILATGRRDPRIYAIDFNAALKSRNPSPNAIVSRSKVLPDRLDGTPLGDPANIVLSEDNRTAYVINHHGAVDNAEFLQHGGRGSVSVMDVKKMISATSTIPTARSCKATTAAISVQWAFSFSRVVAGESLGKLADRGRLEPHQSH